MSGWFSVQRMSVAFATPSPGRSAFLAARLCTTTRWLSWKSDWISRHSLVAVGVERRGRSDDLEDAADAHLHVPRIAGDKLELSARIGFLEHLAIPRPFGDRCLVLVALEQEVPQRPQQPRLGLEGEVDGLEGNVGLGGDIAHRRRWIALFLEEQLGRLEDASPRRRRLLLAARRVIAAPALDSIRHSATLTENSFYASCSEMGTEPMNTTATDQDRDGTARASAHDVGLGGERLGHARRRPRHDGRRGHGGDAPGGRTTTGRARPRAGLRCRRRRSRRGHAGGAGRRGCALRRRPRDDRHSRHPRRSTRRVERAHAGVGHRGDRRAGRDVRRRALPRGVDVRHQARTGRSARCAECSDRVAARSSRCGDRAPRTPGCH